MATRYMMYTSSDNRTEVHTYCDDEMAEVFGPSVVQIDTHGFWAVNGGVWVDMERAAKKRTGQVRMAMNDRARRK